MTVVLWLVACGITETAPPAEITPPVDRAPPTEVGREKPDRKLGFEGMGEVRFGMDRAEVEQALGRPLHGETEEGCHLLTPRPEGEKSPISLMFDEAKLRRIDVSGPAIEAEGGGRVGMTVDEIRRLYPNATEEPHKYLEGALYLTVEPPAVGNAKLLFETDDKGRVHSFRAGLSPQVEYVEGCS